MRACEGADARASVPACLCLRRSWFPYQVAIGGNPTPEVAAAAHTDTTNYGRRWGWGLRRGRGRVVGLRKLTFAKKTGI